MYINKLHKLLIDCNYLVSTDTRKITSKSIFFALKGKNFDGNEYALEALDTGASYVIVDSDLKNDLYKDQIIKVENVLQTLQELSKFNRQQSTAKVIALTGSNGKTSTKELIKTVLENKYDVVCTEGNLNNHIGVPLSLLKIKPDTEIAIIEMGANNFGEIDFLTKLTLPDIGYITNFGKAHLEGFKNIDGVIKGKTELYRWILKNKKSILINSDDKTQIKFIDDNSVTFGSKENSHYNFNDISENRVSVKYKNKIISTNLYGNYNFSNVCAAISLGLFFKIDINTISEKLQNFELKNNRSEFIIKNDKKIILDAYNANPSSMKTAIESFDMVSGTKIAILGDMYELGDQKDKEHKEIIEYCLLKKIDDCVFIGEIFYQQKKEKQSHHFFRNKNDFFEKFKSISAKNILIKGSRGMKMEEIYKRIL